MNEFEQMFLNKMQEDTFHNVMNDDFDFSDSLIDPNDIEKAND